MTPVYKAIFADAAAQFKLWILVRETNELSYRYIPRLDFVGKPIDIKVKTADMDAGKYEVGGLVADPTIPALQAAFRPSKLQKAIILWKAMLHERPLLAEGRQSGPYAIITDSKDARYGCLTRDGKCIHGDFDLYDIVEAGRANLGLVRTAPAVAGSDKTTTDVIPHHWSKVAQLINSRIGKTMIYHGGDFQFINPDQKPGHADDRVDAFGPEREHVFLDGTRSIAAFYGNRFPNRKSMRQHF